MANTCTLNGSVKAGGYFLIQEAKGDGGSTALPTPDAECTASMSVTNGSRTIRHTHGRGALSIRSRQRRATAVALGLLNKEISTGLDTAIESTSISHLALAGQVFQLPPCERMFEEVGFNSSTKP